ncbi:MAG: hypothetical protein HC789_03620 [Microcoleus sp. CSU_2_2]|nr:hypothetical protein [Microcoleus sp. SU_5_3]NJS09522.1 hypothetical protein [Microcoleus sp. CSU_2_2]
MDSINTDLKVPAPHELQMLYEAVQRCRVADIQAEMQRINTLDILMRQSLVRCVAFYNLQVPFKSSQRRTLQIRYEFDNASNPSSYKILPRKADRPPQIPNYK